MTEYPEADGRVPGEKTGPQDAQQHAGSPGSAAPAMAGEVPGPGGERQGAWSGDDWAFPGQGFPAEDPSGGWLPPGAGPAEPPGGWAGTGFGVPDGLAGGIYDSQDAPGGGWPGAGQWLEDPSGRWQGQSWPQGSEGYAGAGDPAGPGFPLAGPAGSRPGENPGAGGTTGWQVPEMPGQAASGQLHGQPWSAQPQDAQQGPRAAVPGAWDGQGPHSGWRPPAQARGAQPWRGPAHRAGRRPGRGPSRLAIVVAVVVAVVVVMILIVVARALLAGKAHDEPAAAPAAGGPSAAAAFPGYPGRHGAEDVAALSSAGGTQVAVGTADDRPAIWHRAGSGPWSLLAAGPVTMLPAGTALDGVAHGPAGWLATGNPPHGGTWQQPVVLASADGTTWQSASAAAFAGTGISLNAAAASGAGYVIVGSQTLWGVPYDAMWWSADLRHWTRGGDTIAATVSSPGSGMRDSVIYAVTAVPAGGFVAVGTHNGCHTAWVTTDGTHWTSYDIPKPPGTHDPVLRQVAVAQGVIMAAGDIATPAGRYPLAVVSTDGGKSWKATTLGGPGTYGGPQGTVTALAAGHSGFIAEGLSGPPGAQRAVTWTSRDGSTWSAAAPVGGGTRQVTALDPDGTSITRVSQVPGSGGDRAVSTAVTAP